MQVRPRVEIEPPTIDGVRIAGCWVPRPAGIAISDWLTFWWAALARAENQPDPPPLINALDVRRHM